MSFQNPAILAVEDHPIERRLLELLSRELGFNMTVVSCARDALNLLSGGHNFQLVLMDWSMPGALGDGMNGLECTRRIRELESVSGRRVPIIAVTAHAMLGDKNRCLEAGMDDYLSKPFTADQFREKVQSWLDTRGAGAVS